MPFEVGAIAEGKVVGITKFGAFIEMEDGTTGLVHISEIAERYVTDVNEHLKEGEKVSVKVISIDEKGKLSLSIKKAMEDRPKRSIQPPQNIDWSTTESENLSFEERMQKFKKDSEEKLSDLKKSFESKRGGGGYRRSSQY